MAKLDTKMYVKAPAGKDDWDVAIATLYPNYGKALDFSQADDDKQRAIAAAHYKTADESQQDRMAATRFEMRDFVGSAIMREVTLRGRVLGRWLRSEQAAAAGAAITSPAI